MLKKIILNLPLIGLWFYLLSSQSYRNTYRHAFIIHVAWLFYFFISGLVLNTLVWVLPYFFEIPLEILIKANYCIVILGYLFVFYLTLTDQISFYFLYRKWFVWLQKIIPF